jgi:tetratricopeptide (TPR) repeat protein
MARSFESAIGTSHALLPLGHLTLCQADYAAAGAFYEEALALARASNQKGIVASSLCGLSIVAFKQGRLAAARSLMRESLWILQKLRNKQEIMPFLEWLACMACTPTQTNATTRRLEVSAALRALLADPTPSSERRYQAFARFVHLALGEDVLTISG